MSSPLPITDDYSPRYQYDVSHPLLCYFYDHNSGPIALTGVNFGACQLLFRSRSNNVTFTGAGTWGLIVSSENNTASYTWAAGDVVNIGVFDIQAVLSFPDGPLTFDAKPIEFLARI